MTTHHLVFRDFIHLMLLRGKILVICTAPFEINRNKVVPHSCTACFQLLHMGFSHKDETHWGLITSRKSLCAFVYRGTMLWVVGILLFSTEKYTKVIRALTSLTVLFRHLQWIVRELRQSLNLGRYGLTSLLSLWLQLASFDINWL